MGKYCVLCGAAATGSVSFVGQGLWFEPHTHGRPSTTAFGEAGLCTQHHETAIGVCLCVDGYGEIGQTCAVCRGQYTAPGPVPDQDRRSRRRAWVRRLRRSG